MDKDEILGLFCRTHKARLEEYCQAPQCKEKFICGKCKEVNKSHQYLHNKEIIPISQVVSSYYLHHKMAHDLLKHKVGAVPKQVTDFLGCRDNTLKMVASHFEMQRQQVDSLATRVLAEAHDQVTLLRDTLLTQLAAQEKLLTSNLNDFSSKIVQLEGPLNKSYEEVVATQRTKLIQKEDKQRLSFLQENYDWFNEKHHESALDNFASEYTQKRDSVLRSLSKMTHSLGLLDKDRMLGQARGLIKNGFIRPFEKELQLHLLDDNSNSLIKTQLAELRGMNAQAEDMVTLRQKRMAMPIENFQMKNTVLKNAHQNNIYQVIVHQEAMLSLAADDTLKVWQYPSKVIPLFYGQKALGSLKLDCNTKTLVGQPSSLAQVSLGDSLGFITQVDYARLKILHRFKAHDQEINKMLVHRYKSVQHFTDLLVTVSSDSTLKVWDLYQINQGRNEDSLMAQLETVAPLTDLALTSDSRVLVLCKNSVAVYLLQPSSTLPLELQLESTVEEENTKLLSIAIQENSVYLGDSSGRLGIYRLSEEGQLRIEKRVVLPVSEHLFYWADKLLMEGPLVLIGVTTPQGTAFCVYDSNSQKVKHQVAPALKRNQSCLTAAHGPFRAVSGGHDRSIQLWKY